MISKESKEARKVSVDLVKDNPLHLKKYITGQTTLNNFKVLTMKRSHSLTEKDLSPRILKQLQNAYEIQPENYEELISLKGIGKKSVRALALISELIYGEPASWKDIDKISSFLGHLDLRMGNLVFLGKN